MNAKLLTTSFASFALLCSGVASGQAPAEDARPQVLLQADSSELGKRGTGLDGIMLGRLGPALEAEGIDPSGSILNLGVRVRVVPVDIEAFHYSIMFEIEQDGVYTQVLGAVDCKPCIDATLLEKIDARTPALADIIKERVSEAQSPPDEASTDGASTDGGSTDGGETGGEQDSAGASEEDSADIDEPKPIGPLGYTGIGAAALGLGATIAGAIELSRGLVLEPGAADHIQNVDHRPPGYVLVGVGATAVVVGAALLGVDLGVRARRRKNQDPAREAVVFPILTPDGVGVGVSGRF